MRHTPTLSDAGRNWNIGLLAEGQVFTYVSLPRLLALPCTLGNPASPPLLQGQFGGCAVLRCAVLCCAVLHTVK